MEDENPNGDIRRYGLTIALDRDEFFRRVCPSCGRYFKIKADDEDLAFALQPTFQEVGPDYGEATSGQSEDQDEETYLCCPYCGERSPINETVTDEVWAYIHRHIAREFILPSFRAMNAELERSFGSHRTHASSGISVSISFEAADISLPPSPISGPELPDMKRVLLLCCNNEIAILDGWRDIVVCPFCDIQCVLQ